jgi:hypothetical protein
VLQFRFHVSTSEIDKRQITLTSECRTSTMRMTGPLGLKQQDASAYKKLHALETSAFLRSDDKNSGVQTGGGGTSLMDRSRPQYSLMGVSYRHTRLLTKVTSSRTDHNTQHFSLYIIYYSSFISSVSLTLSSRRTIPYKESGDCVNTSL